MRERLGRIRRMAQDWTLIISAGVRHLLRLFDREQDVVERLRNLTHDEVGRCSMGSYGCCGGTSGYAFCYCAEAESRRMKPDLWADCDDGIPCTDAPCAPAEPATAAITNACTYHESAPLLIPLLPESPCLTCGGRMGYQMMTVPGRLRCFHCEPEPSQWLREPERAGWGWLWEGECVVDHPVCVHRYATTTPWLSTVGAWQPDWRWMPLETPAPPEETP